MNTLTHLSIAQTAIVESATADKVFLEGPAGAGKTTVGVAWMLRLLETGVPGEQTLVLVPQRTLAAPYYEARQASAVAPGGLVEIATIGGLAQRMVDLFWPLVVDEVGFAYPNRRPVFLTLETAQYYMARIAHPKLDAGGFETITLERNRLYSQLLDNLSKAAAVGFPHTEIAERLKTAWVGEPAQALAYDEAQVCVNQFRDYCLDHNLLDFSLQLEIFLNYLWPDPLCREYLLDRYTWLIVDNLEENPPVTYDVLRAWLPQCISTLVIWDQDAGYRSFLGADPETVYKLKAECDTHTTLVETYVTTPALQGFGQHLARALGRWPRPAYHAPEPKPAYVAETQEAALFPQAQSQVTSKEEPSVLDTDADEIRTMLQFTYHRYYPQMLDWVASEIDTLVHDAGIPPGEIVVLAPYLTDALRFSLTNRLEEARGIPTLSHRPSRALREEPATHCLLTLAALAHPQWHIQPTPYDITYALMQALEDLDLVRAQLLSRVLYRVTDGLAELYPFEQLKPEMQTRITYLIGGRYEALRAWIQDSVTETLRGDTVELDHFLTRLFGEVLSQPGFGFHKDLDAGQVAANLIESVQKFRWVIGDNLQEGQPLGKEYLQMVRDGVVAAQYVRSWTLQPEDAVLLAPAYTFLMSNRAVEVQFWLNVGARGWWERLYQPLTHPYVLSRHWPQGTPWTDEHEFIVRQESLHRLTQGLVRRCRRAIYLGLSELGEQGFEQEGPLLRAIQRVLRETRNT